MFRSYKSDLVFYNGPLIILGVTITVPHTLFCVLLYSGFLFQCWICFLKCGTFLSKYERVRSLTKCTHKLVRMVLGQAFKPGTNDSEEDPKTAFYGYQVTNFVVYAFAQLVLEMLLVLAIIFWDKFVFKLSHGCPYNVDVPNLICYNSTSHSPVNCSNSEEFELHNDLSIECYKLIFDWSSAAGATGGTYVLLSFGITFIPRMLLKIKTEVIGSKIRVYYLLIIFIMTIEIVVFSFYIVFLANGNHSLGVYLSTYAVFLILLGTALVVMPLREFTNINEPNTEVHLSGANESTYLITKHPT